MILTPTELEVLTAKQRPSAQATALKGMHIPFIRRGDGSIVCLKAAVEKRLGMSDFVHERKPQLVLRKR